jgi:DtxR family transcriptional regulator, Mn-dependent transcriptional regulator
MPSTTEENYLKVIYHLSSGTSQKVLTNQLAQRINSTAASVTDMLARLSDKKMVVYKKYYGVSLSEKGRKVAVEIIRRHRLWEVFLAEKLGFEWDEVHAIAEELEHVSGNDLIERLDKFLDYPKTDPHGDPIPDSNGKFIAVALKALTLVEEGENVIINKIMGNEASLLSYLKKNGLVPGAAIKVSSIHSFDKSMDLTTGSKKKIHISRDLAEHLLVKAI